MKISMALLVFHSSTDFRWQPARASSTLGLRKPQGDGLEGASRTGIVSGNHTAFNPTRG